MSTSTKLMSRARAVIAKISREERPTEEKWLRDSMRAAEKKSGYVALYIVAPISQGWPIAFGICSDPVVTYHSYQKGWWEEHGLQVLLWTPGKPAAERVKKRLMEALSPKRKFFSRSWYDVSVAEAHALMLKIAKEEGVSLFDEVERQRRFAAAARMDREVEEGVTRGPQARSVTHRPSAAILPLRQKTEKVVHVQKANP
jgi:hypothetical protein